MNFNVVDLVKDYISDRVVEQLGNATGSDTARANTAISGAVPGLLGEFLGKSTNAHGADDLFNAISAQDDSILDNLTGLFSAGNTPTMANSGAYLLGALLGNKTLNNLIQAVSTFSGLGRGSSSSLLGLLTPVVMGAIKRKLLDSGNFSVNGLAGMLEQQKPDIQAAMPEAFRQLVHIDRTDETAGSLAGLPGKQKKRKKKSWPGYLLPLILLAIVAYMLYQFFILNSMDRADQTSPAGQTEQPSTAGRQGPVNIISELRNTLTAVASALQSVDSIDTAKAAVPEIDDAADVVNKLAGMSTELSEADKGAAVKLIISSAPHLQVLINKINRIPGVGKVVNPSIQNLADQLAKFR